MVAAAKELETWVGHIANLHGALAKFNGEESSAPFIEGALSSEHRLPVGLGLTVRPHSTLPLRALMVESGAAAEIAGEKTYDQDNPFEGGMLLKASGVRSDSEALKGMQVEVTGPGAPGEVASNPAASRGHGVVIPGQQLFVVEYLLTEPQATGALAH